MKKLLATILIFIILATPAMAVNTHTTVLEVTSSQFWSVADGSQTGLDIATDGDFSIMMWVNPDQLPSTASALAGLIFKCDAATSDGCYRMRFNTNDTLYFLYGDSAGNLTVSDTDAAFLVGNDVGNWAHITVTVDVSAKQIIFYKNASAVNDTNILSNATTYSDNTYPFIIGARYQSGAALQHFDGKIDSVRIFDKVLTPTEISDNYNCSLEGNEANVISSWPLDNDGTDSNANENDLVNNNSATFQSGDLPFTDSCAAPPAPPAVKFLDDDSVVQSSVIMPY